MSRQCRYVATVLAEALRYYTNPEIYKVKHHEMSGHCGEIEVVDEDKGRVARRALETVNGKVICL